MNANERDKMNAVTKIKTNETQLINSLKQQFVDSVNSGIKSWQTAGQTLVKLVAIDPKIIDKLQTEKGVPRHLLRMFLAIGRGELLPELLTAPQALRRLPVEDQERVASGLVEALVMRPDGTNEVVKVDLLKAVGTPIYKQVVGRNGILSVAEQKASIVSKANTEIALKVAKEKNPVSVPWHVEGKCIVVTAGTRLTKKDVLAMLNSIA